MNFTEHNHKYYTDSNVEYRSVTTILSKLKNPKDWDEILKKRAKKLKISPEELQAQWDKEKNSSCEKGTAYHNKREKDLIDTGYVKYDDEHLCVHAPTWEDGVKKAKSLKLEPGVYPELLMWLDSIGIAGQADYVEITSKKVLNVDDYKTNKKIEFKGYTNWAGKTEKLLYPVNHLDECNGSIYALQLNFYAYIILRHNPQLRLGRMRILHITVDEDGKEVTIPYTIPNLQNEIKMLVNLIKENKL